MKLTRSDPFRLYLTEKGHLGKGRGRLMEQYLRRSDWKLTTTE